LRLARDSRDQLLAELQNRSRNTLSVIRSILRRSAARSGSVEDFAQHLEGRLGAYGRAQSTVMRNRLAGADLATLLTDELLAHAVHEGDKVRLEGADVRLQSRAAELYALVFNELILNAIKFGALREGSGHVDVTWEFVGERDNRRLRFRWKESNLPSRLPEPGIGGFGTELIERNLSYELDAKGRLLHDPDGVECVIEAPATRRLIADDQGAGGAPEEASLPPS
ncbi:sensor histidine kinase, partial [bacterium]